jgi:trk system potassium uptake protein TrkA
LTDTRRPGSLAGVLEDFMPITRKQFAVIGLGRFGSSVCQTLKGLGHEVLGMDSSEELTREAHANHIATHVVRGDSTDIHSLDEIGMRNFDTVVVAIGSDMEASILTVLNLQDLGVKNIIAKAGYNRHGKVLERIGGDTIRVVYPESQMGERVAHSIGGTGIVEQLELDPNYSIIEIPVPHHLIGKTLQEADLRARYGVTVIAILSKGSVNVAPLGDDRFNAGDIIAVIGANDKLDTLRR